MEKATIVRLKEQAKCYSDYCSMMIGNMQIREEVLLSDEDEATFRGMLASARLVNTAATIIEELSNQVNELNERVKKLETKKA